MDAPTQPWTLVLPSVAHGGVGQLALDALMNTALARSKVPLARHCFVTPHVAPMASTRALDCDESIMTTAVEWVQDGDVVLLQIRAPVLAGHVQLLCDEIVAWAAGAKALVVLGGIDANARTDEQLRTTQLRAIGTTQLRSSAAWPGEWTPLEAPAGEMIGDIDPMRTGASFDPVRTPPAPPTTVSDDGAPGAVSVAQSALQPAGYAGLLVPLLEARERAGAAALGLAVWADEGQQNFALGLQLGALAAAHIGLPHELQAPRSWAIASSGREWDPSLF
jgi:hypothetical protein